MNHTIVKTQDSVIVKVQSPALISHCQSVISTRNRLAFNSNGPTTSTCKWNTN